ncbi:hypothetical protein CCR75_006156 [Bremia lactucae]|uniref:TLC domain-containing protein n=1 Tax=Bremia lactucae TaxID=4779 RepID=A0A976IJL0_BRELC|nr:hypothetical protein CCR75_006156 [Bremia lactucae]
MAYEVTPTVGTSRASSLAAAAASGVVLWTFILYVVSTGFLGRNKTSHIITLNATHGVLSTLASTITLYFGLDTTLSVAISLSYFLVDLFVMVHSDGPRNILSLRQSRLMDYGHHILGLYWGIVLFKNEATVCDASFGNAYVWMQTNEVSTGFYNWFRLTDSRVAGAMFAISFFFSRIVFNTVYIIPRVATQCQPLYILGCSPYFVLQYVWFYMIARKLLSGGSQVHKIRGEHSSELENKKNK